MQNSFDYSNSFAGNADTNLQISMYLSNANSSTLNLFDRKRVFYGFLWFFDFMVHGTSDKHFAFVTNTPPPFTTKSNRKKKTDFYLHNR